jgi:hypothetical protein
VTEILGAQTGNAGGAMSSHDERRQSPRVDVVTSLVVRSQDIKFPLRLLDVSLGGFSTSSSEALELGRMVTVQFASGDQSWTAALRARVVYCRRQAAVPGRRQPVEYHSGFAFLQSDRQDVQARLGQIIDRATAVITFS